MKTLATVMMLELAADFYLKIETSAVLNIVWHPLKRVVTAIKLVKIGRIWQILSS
jgi:hypothetical protein